MVINRRAGERYGSNDYVNSGSGMGRETTLHLLERGIRVTGIDGWSGDPPTRFVAEKVKLTRDASLIREGHKAGMEVGSCHLEKQHQLETLPSAAAIMPGAHPLRVAGADSIHSVDQICRE